MDDAYLDELRERAQALAGTLMPPRLYGPRHADEWAAIERTLTEGLEHAGLRYADGAAARAAAALVGAARAARRFGEDG